MPRFKYVAMDPKGSESDGVLDAANQAEAVSLIRARGFFPTRVTEMDSGALPKSQQRQAKGADAAPKSGLHMELKMPNLMVGKIKTKHLMVLTRQLATLVEAGLPLLRGLRILLQQEKHPQLREALNGLGEAVEGGSTLSEALSMYPKVFDTLFVNMVKAGEAGGVLDVVLVRLAEFMEKSERIRRKVRSAMIYPIVVLVVAVGILGFLLTRIIPSFAEIFQDLLEGAELPALTQFVINISDWVRHNGLVIFIAVVVLTVGIRLWRRTKGGTYVLDMMQLKAPLFGSLFMKTAVARFARTLGTLMSSGVPVLQALNIVRDTSGNDVVARAIQGVHDSVKEGDSMSLPMEASGIFPGMVVSMVDVGEETGALPEMLTRVADNYEEEVDAAVEGLTSIIEPIMIVMLAFIVGTIVIAMFVPLIDIITRMSAA